VVAQRPLLLQCLDISDETRVIALVGAGGKTSLMYALASEMVFFGDWVVTTTTTKIRPPEKGQSSLLILTTEDPELKDLRSCLHQYGHVTVGRSLLSEGKVEGISEETVNLCLKWASRVVIEADGANGRSIKAPETWEPVIPSFADLVIPVISLDCIGRSATDRWVFRLQRFLEVTGMQVNENITPEAVGRLVAHAQGAMKNVPGTAKVVPFLNKEDLLEAPWTTQSVADAILAHGGGRIERVVAGQLKEGIRATAYER